MFSEIEKETDAGGLMDFASVVEVDTTYGLSHLYATILVGRTSGFKYVVCLHGYYSELQIQKKFESKNVCTWRHFTQLARDSCIRRIRHEIL